jgi:outer membrane protein TolC
LAQVQPLSLEEAVRIGESQSPRVEAQQFAVTAAGEQIARAAELPDPKLRFGIENLPVTGADRYRYDRDFMTSRVVGLSQELTSGAKRAARETRATRSRDVEQAMLGSQRAMLRRDIATAWMDVHFAERSRLEFEALVRELAGQVEASPAGVARGTQPLSEALGARMALAQAREKAVELERLVQRARIALAALLASDAQRPLAPPPDTVVLHESRETLLGRLHEHPHLRVYDVREDLARAEIELARAGKKPDWSVEVGYGHRRPAFDNMVTVMLAVDLPWQAEKRQDRDVASRLADAQRARAEREEASRVHQAEMRGWLADFDAAAERMQRIRSTLLPLSQDRIDAALAAYRGGRGALAPVLEARRAAADTRLSLIAVEAERAKAWASLTYLYPHEAGR